MPTNQLSNVNGIISSCLHFSKNAAQHQKLKGRLRLFAYILFRPSWLAYGEGILAHYSTGPTLSPMIFSMNFVLANLFFISLNVTKSSAQLVRKFSSSYPPLLSNHLAEVTHMYFYGSGLKFLDSLFVKNTCGIFFKMI